MMDIKLIYSSILLGTSYAYALAPSRNGPLRQLVEDSDTSPSAATIIDLSKDLPEDKAAMEFSEGAKAMEQAAIAEPRIRAAIVMENGKIVSSYYRQDVTPSDVSPIFSGTKSWTGLLIGLLVDDGVLSVDQTLGEMFPEDAAWTDVTDGSEDFRKNVTIEELLTMTSGLLDPPGSLVVSFFRGASEGGGSSLSDSLAYPSIGEKEKGKVTYLSLSNILSYVIFKLTGMTPGELLAERVMPHLGIQVDDYVWSKNSDGLVENAFTGLEVTPTMLVKFGQLYMQNGLAGPHEEQRVVSQDWVEASFTRHSHLYPSSYPVQGYLGADLGAAIPVLFAEQEQGEPDAYYGYLFMGHPSKPNIYCSVGLGGTDLCIDPDIKRVVLQQTDYDYSMRDIMDTLTTSVHPAFDEVFKLVQIGLDETLSFSDSASHEVNGTSTSGEMEFPKSKSVVNALKSEELSNSSELIQHVSLATFFGLSAVLNFFL